MSEPAILYPTISSSTVMNYLTENKIAYEEIDNGALLLLLLRDCNTWEELCERYAYADPAQITTNTTTFTLRNKLLAMREAGLISFKEEITADGIKPVGEIRDTGLWTKIRVALGGMSLTDAALLSRHAKGSAFVPAFGRPNAVESPIDIFVLMPFHTSFEKVYFGYIGPKAHELGLKAIRADDIFSPKPFMEKVWDGICAAKLILADCTSMNPNVFYEIGIAHTVGKKIVFITRSPDDIPSDIKHYEYILYDDANLDHSVNRITEYIKKFFRLDQA